MAVEIRVPALGESIVDAVIATWLKSEGDEVKQGEALVELETDKVNVEVSAEQSGVLQNILKQTGDVVTVGEVLGMVGESVKLLLASLKKLLYWKKYLSGNHPMGNSNLHLRRLMGRNQSRH